MVPLNYLGIDLFAFGELAFKVVFVGHLYRTLFCRDSGSELLQHGNTLRCNTPDGLASLRKG
jgi:hypothetical protein